MKKLLVTTAITLTATLFLTTAHAGNNGKKWGHGHSYGKSQQAKHRSRNRGGKGGTAVISYIIDPGSCAVTINSTKSLSNIVLKNSAGEKVMKWANLSGKSFSDFGIYSAILADGSLYVKSGNNGKRGKRNRGLGAEIGDTFKDDLTNCLDAPVVAQCPSQIKDEIDRVIASVPTDALEIYDLANSCEIYGTAGISVGIYNGLNPNNGFRVGASFTAPDGMNTVLVDLTLEEADACQLYTARCDAYNNLLP